MCKSMGSVISDNRRPGVFNVAFKLYNKRNYMTMFHFKSYT